MSGMIGMHHPELAGIHTCWNGKSRKDNGNPNDLILTGGCGSGMAVSGGWRQKESGICIKNQAQTHRELSRDRDKREQREVMEFREGGHGEALAPNRVLSMILSC